MFFEEFEDENIDEYEEMDLLYATIHRSYDYDVTPSHAIYGDNTKSNGLIDDKIIQQMEKSFNRVSR